MKRREVLNEIDETLDQLIKNAAALKEVSEDPLFAREVEALKKTQESLLARLLHLDQFLDDKPDKNIAEKRMVYKNLSGAPKARRRPFRKSRHTNV
ncbi:MAG: hypothetical protein H7A38_04475 [Chlamydiales bacterium]|nr:hypothetical protein [Chlamydiales bacterium]